MHVQAQTLAPNHAVMFKILYVSFNPLRNITDLDNKTQMQMLWAQAHG